MVLSFQDSTTILIASFILVSPAYICGFLLYREKANLKRTFRQLAGLYFAGSITTDIAVNSIFKCDNTQSDKQNYNNQRPSLLTDIGLEREITLAEQFLDDEMITIPYKENENRYEYYLHINNLVQCRKKQTVIELVLDKSLDTIEKSIDGTKGIKSNVMNKPELRPIILKLSEILANRTLSPLGELLFEIFPTLLMTMAKSRV